MKNLVVSFALLISVLGVSCKKGNEAQPNATGAAIRKITVEYMIICPSGAANADFIAPNLNSGVLAMTHLNINATSYRTKFTCPTGTFLSVSAMNAIPTGVTTEVKIFVDGLLVAESESNNPSIKAIASGNF